MRKKENYLAAKLPEVIFAVLKTKWRVGQGVKTPPFHGGITGSIPVRGTRKRGLFNMKSPLFLCLYLPASLFYV